MSLRIGLPLASQPKEGPSPSRSCAKLLEHGSGFGGAAGDAAPGGPLAQQVLRQGFGQGSGLEVAAGVAAQEGLQAQQVLRQGFGARVRV